MGKSKRIAPVRVLVTGAAGQIGYVLCPMIAKGLMLGPNQPIILHMLDLPQCIEPLKGVKMELMDCAYPLLRGCIATCDVVEAFKGVEFALLCGGFPRKDGMERKDVISKNVVIARDHGIALEEHAHKDVKVCVMTDPANTTALILKEFAPSLPEKNITCLTRLDHNRALGVLAERLDVPASDIKNVIVWGNHSKVMYPDINLAKVMTHEGDVPVRTLVNNDEWLSRDFVNIIQHRGTSILKARKLSSALSAASAACDHVRDWVLGTPEGRWVSMGVYGDGSYDVTPGLMYSYPVTCKNGEWSIVQDIYIDDFTRARLDASTDDLIQEKSLAYKCLKS